MQNEDEIEKIILEGSMFWGGAEKPKAAKILHRAVRVLRRNSRSGGIFSRTFGPNWRVFPKTPLSLN
jgi:hypothetical protein